MSFETGMFEQSFEKLETEMVHILLDEARVDSIETNGSGITIRKIPGTEGFYNAAAWEVDGVTHLLGRKVEKAAEEGMPDVGSLMLLTLDQDGNIASSREVWHPRAGAPLLEDVRALVLGDGGLAFGLTSVIEEAGRYVPYPSVLFTSTRELDTGTLPEPTIIKSMGYGEQTLPIGEDSTSFIGKNAMAIGPNMFVFRPDNNNHQLRVFEYSEAGDVKHLQYIDFPKDIPWAKHKVGTTMPPIWLNEREAIFPIHGINIVNGKYVYAIGSSRLFKSEDGKLSVDNISYEPLIDPDLFVELFGEEQEELHPERRVVYCCGGIPVLDNIVRLRSVNFYITVGDMLSVEAAITAAKLTEGWMSSNTIGSVIQLSGVA